MPMRVGYACVNTQLPSASRSIRLANLTAERLYEVVAANLDALATILRWNREHGIEVFRISSDTVPLGSHPANTFPWREALEAPFAEAGSLMAGMSLSTHPGQYTVLGSPEERFVTSSLAEVEYHARLLEAFGLDRSAKIVV